MKQSALEQNMTCFPFIDHIFAAGVWKACNKSIKNHLHSISSQTVTCHLFAPLTAFLCRIYFRKWNWHLVGGAGNGWRKNPQYWLGIPKNRYEVQVISVVKLNLYVWFIKAKVYRTRVLSAFLKYLIFLISYFPCILHKKSKISLGFTWLYYLTYDLFSSFYLWIYPLNKYLGFFSHFFVADVLFNVFRMFSCQ